MANLVIEIPESIALHERTIDFRRHLGKGFDEILSAAVEALRDAVADGEWAPKTLVTICAAWRNVFLPWLEKQCITRGAGIALGDINKELIEEFIADLKKSYKYVTANQNYMCVVSGLRRISSLNLLPPVQNFLPLNPFPGANAAGSTTPPYSVRERKMLVRALAEDYREISGGRFKEPKDELEALVVCLLLIAFQSGFNLTPLLEIRRDAIRAHPIRAGMHVLTGFKRRANKDVSVTLGAQPISAGGGGLGVCLQHRTRADRSLGSPDARRDEKSPFHPLQPTRKSGQAAARP